MKKFFLTMLVGLLPIIGWAAEVPEPFLVEDYTEYAGNQTPQPVVVNGTITKISYLGLEGNDPATVVFDAATPPSYTVPVRNAGFYEVEAVDQAGAAVAEPFVYEVGPFEITVSPTPIQRIYGDPEPQIEYGYNVDLRPGDYQINYVVKGGTPTTWSMETDQVGVLNYSVDESKSKAYMYYAKTGERCYNYTVKTTGNSTITTAEATIEVAVIDLKKTYGECDDDAVIADETLEEQYIYTGFKYDDDMSVIDGIDADHPSWSRENKSEDVGEYPLTVDITGLSAQNYVFKPAAEQGKLTIEQKSILDDDVEITIKWKNGDVYIDDDVVDPTDPKYYAYGTVLTKETTIVHKNVCIIDGDNKDYTLEKDKDYCDACGDDQTQLCGQGNYKDCSDITVPTPKPACLTVVASAEPATITVGEDLNIQYEISGWKNDEDFSAELAAVLTYVVKDADGNKVEEPIANVGEYTIEVVVPDELPDALINYSVCDDPEDITVTVDPICIEQAEIRIIDQPVDENDRPSCFPFTGGKIEPAIEVYYGETKLDEGTDYEVAYGDETHNNTSVAQGGIITVTGKGNYGNPDCTLTKEFCIAPGNATVRVAPIDFSKSITIEGQTFYQNGRYYGQAENDIVLEYDGITEEAFKALGIEAHRWGGPNVGFYTVAFYDQDKNQLTPGKMGFFDIRDNDLETCTITPEGSDITITLVPGYYEIRKQGILSFSGELKTIYGDRELINPATADINALFAEFKDKFVGKGFLEDDEMTWINKDTGLPRPEVIDISNATIQLYAYDEETGEIGEAINGPCNNNGDYRYLPAGTFAVKVENCTSSNYYLGDIVLKVINQKRKVKIWIDPMVLGPRETFNEEAVTWSYQRNNEGNDSGIALLDTDEDPDYNASLARVPGNADIKQFFNIRFRYSYDAQRITLYVHKVSPFNPNYEPIVRRSELGENDGHFILHRVYSDLQNNPWNDAVQKITSWAYDNDERWGDTPEEERVVPRVYFRTFNAAEAVSDNLFDMFGEGEDGEWEPITAEVGGELDTEKGFPMYAKKWYAMVLPFDVTVYELGHEFFEYGVINVLDESNTDESVIAFKLQTTGTIKANTPFCVQLGDMGRVNEELPFVVKNLDQMYFENKKIVKPENFDEIFVEDKSGVKFYASYTGKLGFAENERYYTTSANPKYDDGFLRGGVNPNTGNENTTWMRPTGAYLSLPADEARTLIMQEEDGSFTQIKSIENIYNVKSTEGWYTTNGMKLNAQPTEKGVYIHNGKKVVVK